ncbi:MAG: type II and III secretion system protein family protein [Pseudomonadota bacterium]
MRSLRFFAAAMTAAFITSVLPAAVSAQSSGNVLRIARGATSSDVNVFINRAIVLESAEKFAEVSVANPGIADVAALSDQTIYVLGKAPGSTTLTLLGESGRLITNVDVNVSPDLGEFKQRLREILPNENIEVRGANGGVILSGIVSGARKIDTAMRLAATYSGENVTNMMSVGGTQQVMLKIRFAEMARSATKQLGFNLAAGFQGGSTAGTLGTGPLGLNRATGDGATVGNPVGTALVDPGSAIFGELLFSVGDVLVDVLLTALENKGVVRSLAEPNLVALSGDTASFLAGGEVPVPVTDGDGGISVEFKPFGVSMSFTPTVIDEDLINLELATEVSSINTAVTVTAEGISLSGFTTRRASTTVEMRDGQSMAIAGLLQEDFTDGKTQVPFLGDIPVLGTLFRSSEFQRSQSELVIIITPVLVTPVSGEQLSLPTDRMRIPNEEDLFFFGELEGDAPSSEVATQDLDGSFGYILE